MKYFFKITRDTKNPLFLWASQKPLRMAVLTVIGQRIRLTDSDTLKKGEFKISQNDFELFGLRKSQRGILYRTIQKLLQLGIIEKVDTEIDTETPKNRYRDLGKIGSEHSQIYRLSSNDLVSISREIDTEKYKKQIPKYLKTDTEIDTEDPSLLYYKKNVSKKSVKESIAYSKKTEKKKISRDFSLLGDSGLLREGEEHPPYSATPPSLPKEKYRMSATSMLRYYNKYFGKNYKLTNELLSLYAQFAEQGFELEDFLKAIENAARNEYAKTRDIYWLFKTIDAKGNPVNRIDEFSNLSDTTQSQGFNLNNLNIEQL